MKNGFTRSNFVTKNLCGFTLIESVVVIAILSVIALASMNTITEFQRNAILSSATQELGSTLREAQVNSTAGKLQPGETADSFGGFGIPNYDIHITGNRYELVRMYPNGTIVSEPPLATHSADSTLSLSTDPLNITDVWFYRVTGTRSANITSANITITLSRSNGVSRSATASANGLISL
jgi:prepilin-type N-terminal cleavage/methylation domain-containing protein